jgi:hypothetical protein
MRTYDPDQPLIFTHIPKCAGTSFVRLLSHWFAKTYRKLNQDETRDIVLPKVPAQDAEGRWLPDVRCIHGHFNHGRGYGLPYFYPEITQYITVLRDPFDIVVSMYFFFKARSLSGRYLFRGQPIDIREHYASVEDYVRDYPYWLYDHLPRDVNAKNYREKLAERFVYIGVFEDLDRSIQNLAMLLGKRPCRLPRMNVSQYDEPVPAHLRTRFYADYPLLKQIYDFAVEQHRAFG